MQDIPNRWRMFIGYLAESTTTLNQRTFRVYIPELLPTTSGDVTTNMAIHNVKIKNTISNETEEMAVDLTATVVAEYMGLMISRSVPTMYKGQQVLVYNYANSDVFFWMPLERDDDLRPFEQIRFSAIDEALTNKSDTDKHDVEKRHSYITDDNTYFIEIDTKYHKRILLSTAATDGEAFRYFIKMDAASKSIEIWDTSSDNKTKPCNIISMESDIGKGLSRIKMENSSGTSLILTGEDMTVNVPGNFNMFVGGSAQCTILGNATTVVNCVLNNTVMGDHSYKCGGNLTGTVIGTTGFTGTGLVAYKSLGSTAIGVVGTYTEVITTKNSIIGVCGGTIGICGGTIGTRNLTIGVDTNVCTTQTVTVTSATWDINYSKQHKINIEDKKFTKITPNEGDNT